MTNIVVTGSAGQLGTAMRSVFPDATFLTRSELDLSQPRKIAGGLDTWEPQVLINCAAYTAVDKAEEEESLASVINGAAVGEMAEYCRENGARFVTYSTDYVFDGVSDRPWMEGDATDPVNAYGRSKLVGERKALAAGALVIRTSWVVSGTHPNFIATMLRLSQRQALRVVSDQQGCPTIADDLAAATLAALEANATGLLHLTNEGATSWFEFARAALELADIDPDQIEPCTTSEFPTPAPRPAYSVLGSTRRRELTLDDLPHWRESLPVVVDALFANGVVTTS